MPSEKQPQGNIMQTAARRSFDYDMPLIQTPTSACQIRQAWAKVADTPDRHLGDYIRRETGADMLLWQGSCIVHNEFKGQELAALKAEHPDAVVLVHPESPQSVIELGDVVGSTSKLLKAAVSRPEKKFIVATDLGILHEMQKQAPDKEFIAAPTAGNGGSCKSCAFCPWMAMNSLGGIKHALTSGHNEILLDRKLGEAAKLPLQRMLDFAAGLKKKDVFNGMGPA